MLRPDRRTARALLGSVVVVLLLAVWVTPAAAATQEDCGGGDIDLIQAPDDPAMIIGARVRNVGSACDGQPVGVQFLGNAPGDPAQPSVELAHAYSDQDACTGAELPDGLLRNGTVEVALCSGSASSDYVDGGMLTDLRLITTLEVPAAPGGGEDPAAAPNPGTPGDEPLPTTGASILWSVLLGAAMVLVGAGLLRGSRGVALLRR